MSWYRPWDWKKWRTRMDHRWWVVVVVMAAAVVVVAAAAAAVDLERAPSLDNCCSTRSRRSVTILSRPLSADCQWEASACRRDRPRLAESGGDTAPQMACNRAVDAAERRAETASSRGCDDTEQLSLAVIHV